MPSADQNVNGSENTVPLILNNKPVITEDKFEITNPRTESVLHQCSSASLDDAARAVDSAKAAFPGWSRTKPAIRQNILLKAADVFQTRREELLDYMEQETASAKTYAGAILDLAIRLLKDVAGKVSSIEGTIPILEADGQSGIVLKEPYGVVLSIAPWNAPYILGVRAVALPLAAGNTVVLKGSESSPKCFWAIGDIFHEAGLPDGCLNVLYHRPADAAAITTALIAHPAVKKVNFTGSTDVGSIIAATAGRYVKPVLLELGGKASTIVLDDANLQKAAMGCVIGSFLHSGQICMSTERIIVQRPIVELFRTAFAEATTSLYGRSDPAPVLIRTDLVTKNKGLISNALSQGASALIGDPNAEESSATRMRPVVLENVTPDMDIYATESFGPTVSLYVVDSDDEAIQLANDTEYGLSAAVYTESLGRGLRIAKQLESGAVHINSSTIHDEPALPHGGLKKSGFGRFGGSIGLDEFLTTKSITWMD